MKIGRYDIRGLLGRGGMGAVYKAAMPVTGRIVALKVLKPAEIMEDLLGEETLTEMFLKEAATMASISHANIAAILDVGDGHDGTPAHFTMEYFCGNLGVLMGETYEVEQPSRRLGVEASVHIARQMLSGLDRLHYEGIIHRDVKPFNVMLAEEEGVGVVKLIDFGLSKLRGERTQGHKGMVVGSPYYTAPEQEADPESADARSDIFSVGVTLYRMLTGLLPPQGGEPARPICEVHPDLDCQWDDFFTKALAANPDERFQDGPAMIEAIDALEADWRDHKDAVCNGADLLFEPARHDEGWKPRSAPIKASLRHARDRFGLDELWRPEEYGRGRFAENPDDTVTDRTTGLVWEKYGSRYPLTWEHAHAHVERLNKRRYAGRADWRLPTVDELITLFSGRTEPGDFCQLSVFDERKARLWSSDTKAFTAAWYADAELGFVWWQDRTCRFFARAVCGG